MPSARWQGHPGSATGEALAQPPQQVDLVEQRQRGPGHLAGAQVSTAASIAGRELAGRRWWARPWGRRQCDGHLLTPRSSFSGLLGAHSGGGERITARRDAAKALGATAVKIRFRTASVRCSHSPTPVRRGGTFCLDPAVRRARRRAARCRRRRARVAPGPRGACVFRRARRAMPSTGRAGVCWWCASTPAARCCWARKVAATASARCRAHRPPALGDRAGAARQRARQPVAPAGRARAEPPPEVLLALTRLFASLLEREPQPPAGGCVAVAVTAAGPEVD